ncbi:M50 family metallopeptidase [Fimbriimonas ginsengisoli]|uniref:Putative membrane-associated zinc metalloprotease n=1 Tax=Fimbriimonas ginsengisoli Gsoil 348 TaxID=661478 RepID=A0A068NPE4_FIMGI|nr:M50 family metallopeptidase [Fimbriimonas ginsengisoli]AIE83459.1 putative membrane-associated zinc metalloprotease [Fimbriimonas ginsengisoli Gsoil 348]
MSVTQLLQYAGYGVVFIIMISILVAAHELGHYLFARLFNMGVEEFAIGFGKKPILIWGHRTYTLPIKPGENWDETGGKALAGAENTAALLSASLEGSNPDREIERIETPTGPVLRETTAFTVRPWPLGGFVRIKGMMPEEDGSETKITGGFYSKAPWQRFIVLLAGPMFSILAGIVLLTSVLMVDGKDVFNKQPVLGALTAGKPAELSGLKEGDRVLAIGNKPVSQFYDIIVAVRSSNGAPLEFQVDRAGVKSTHKVVAELDPEPSYQLGPDLETTDVKAKSYKIGILPKTNRIRLPFGAAVAEASNMPIEAVSGLAKLFKHPQNFKDNVGGPVTMVSATAAAVQVGFWKVVMLSALLSISVGIMNLLPAAPLDGGQMLMAVAEMLRGGRRLSLRSQAIANGIGLTFVAVLILSVWVVDIQRLATPSKPKPAAAKPK